MQSREQIIQLGKTLAAEQEHGCTNTTIEGGLEAFLYKWRATADGALQNSAVRQALELLHDYNTQPIPTRHERLTQALGGLRALFRKQPPATIPPLPAPAADGLPPQSPIAEVPGMNHTAARAFKRLKLHTVEDLLYHFPHRYDDYSSQNRIVELQVGSIETIVATIVDVRTFPLKRPNSVGIEVQVRDESGVLKVVFFGSHWMADQFSIGRKIVLSGKITSFQGLLQMNSPDWEPYSDQELLHTGRLVPVHPLTKGLHERNARTIIKTAVERAAPLLPEYLPEPLRQRLGLMPLSTAIAQMHFPDSYELQQQARTRLAFDEFLLLQLYVVQRKKYWQGEMGYSLPFCSAMHQELLTQLPFELTGAQQRVLNEIFSDMRKYVPMARLLQGDVGSGKTIVAAAALLQAIANGFQGALMAPTQILAEQHHRGLQQLLGRVRVRLPRKAAQQVPAADAAGDAWDATLAPERREELNKLKQLLDMMPEDDLNGEGVRVGLLKGRLGKKDRQRVLDAIEKGDVDLIVGTHALITEGVNYYNLGMVCIDEQHRFGVEQRERLKQKSNGIAPHMLVMTATPIPRTLTLTIYGELDTSLLDELPPGRQQIQTRWITSTEYPKAYHHIRKEITKGRQAFVICPLVEESDKVDLPSAEETYEYLQRDVFPDLRVGLIHGRMLPREKDQVMRAFGNHEYDILVATAVVEVGIDVPNATTMMIEGAERFGLAQLHQFRGRVGRGSHRSYCILVSDAEENEVTRQRLEAMEQIHDGFKLAEIDLELRGPGEFFGKRQSGTPDLKVASLADIHLLQRARREAELLLEDDPELSQPEHTLLREKVRIFWEHAQGAS